MRKGHSTKLLVNFLSTVFFYTCFSGSVVAASIWEKYVVGPAKYVGVLIVCGSEVACKEPLQ